ncbi:hypothetical protein FB645_002854 [Coemansia sp. IMI 203386]|nr:hypothetical protein FB645_002854 [Coemansia sp. IMI 203386]
MSELAVFDGLPPLEGAARVKFLESMLKTKIQDNDGSDTGVIIYCAIILFLTGVFLSFVWFNRKYRPLRAKTIKLCTLMYLATIPWALGDFQMNGLYASICVVDDRYRYVSVGLIWVPWCGVLFFAFRIRSIQSSFNELYESLFTCALGFLILIKTTVVHATHPYYLFAKGFRHSETIIDVTATNLIIWIMLGYPAYQCLFNRENYDREWAKKLRTDGYASKYSAEFDSTPNETTSYSRMNDSMFEHNKMGTKDFYDKDPLDTIRMLSANGGGTLTSNTIPSPNSVYRPPLSNLDFGSMNDGSLDSFDNPMDGRTDFRRII